MIGNPPTPVFLTGKSHGQSSLAGYSPWGCRVGHDWVSMQTHRKYLRVSLHLNYIFSMKKKYLQQIKIYIIYLMKLVHQIKIISVKTDLLTLAILLFFLSNLSKEFWKACLSQSTKLCYLWTVLWSCTPHVIRNRTPFSYWLSEKTTFGWNIHSWWISNITNYTKIICQLSTSYFFCLRIMNRTSKLSTLAYKAIILHYPKYGFIKEVGIFVEQAIIGW